MTQTMHHPFSAHSGQFQIAYILLTRIHDLFSSGKNKKPSQKPGKGKKLANRHSGITEIIADHIRSEKDFPFYYEELLQQLFSLPKLHVPYPC